MKYTVTTAFCDMQDENKVYRVGDEYPRHGLTVSESRINQLLSGKNALGISVIKEAANVAENAKKTAETKAETKAETPKPKTTRRTKK